MPAIPLWIVGNFYEKYGVYQGRVIRLGVQYHKFQRHDADESFTEYGDRFYYLQANESNCLLWNV